MRTQIHVDAPCHQKTFRDAGGKELLIGVDQGKIHSPGMASLQQKIRKVHDHKAGVKYAIHDIK